MLKKKLKVGLTVQLYKNDFLLGVNSDIMWLKTHFLSDPGISGPIYGSKSLKLCNRPCADLTDVTLADEDTNSILTDNVNRQSKPM